MRALQGMLLPAARCPRVEVLLCQHRTWQRHSFFPPDFSSFASDSLMGCDWLFGVAHLCTHRESFSRPYTLFAAPCTMCGAHVTSRAVCWCGQMMRHMTSNPHLTTAATAAAHRNPFASRSNPQRRAKCQEHGLKRVAYGCVAQG